MVKSILFALFLLTTVEAFCQVKVSGLILSKANDSPIAGVRVQEKNTQNQVVTSEDGKFTLSVTDANAILQISKSGFSIEELKVTSQQQMIFQLSPKYFMNDMEAQTINMFGMVNMNDYRVGGQIGISSPELFKLMTLQGKASAQTDLDRSFMWNFQAGLHRIGSSGFNADVIWYFRKLDEPTFLLHRSKAYSIETNLNYRFLRVILGYSEIDNKNFEPRNNFQDSGPVVGLGAWIGGPVKVLVAGKIAIYDDLYELQTEVSRRFRQINTFARLYQQKDITEISVGFGTTIFYSPKKEK